MSNDQRTIGVVIRVFAVRPELAPSESKKALTAVRDLIALNKNFTQPVFQQITLVVSTDERYIDSDCGLMLELLRRGTARWRKHNVVVSEAPVGDISCCAMNHGCYETALSGHEYSFTVSSTITSYLNVAIVSRMLIALEKGALVVPLAIGEHRGFVLNGRPLGTCTIWKNRELFNIGGFSLVAARPLKNLQKDRARTRWIEDYWPSRGELIQYSLGGMEEVYAVIELIRLYGRCVAPIDPKGIADGIWIRPIDPERAAREDFKIKTKFSRFLSIATHMGVGPSFCLSGIMDGYGPEKEDIDTFAEY